MKTYLQRYQTSIRYPRHRISDATPLVVQIRPCRMHSYSRMHRRLRANGSRISRILQDAYPKDATFPILQLYSSHSNYPDSVMLHLLRNFPQLAQSPHSTPSWLVIQQPCWEFVKSDHKAKFTTRGMNLMLTIDGKWSEGRLHNKKVEFEICV